MRRFIIFSILCLFPSACFALSFNMQDAPLTDLVDWVSDATGDNIVLSPGINATVTVKVKDIKPLEIFPFFSSILDAHGLALIKKDLFYLVTIKPDSLLDKPLSNSPDTEGAGSGHAVPEPVPEVSGSLYKLFNVSFASVSGALSSVSPSSSFTPVPGSQFFYMSGTDEQHEKITTLLPALDRAAPRVLVEAVVLETTANKYHEVGISIAAILDNARAVASSSFSSARLPGALASYTSTDFRAIVTALDGLDDVQMLSSPSILVSPGASGRVVVGENVPFITGSYSEASEDSKNPFQTIKREDVGLSLTVLPQVISDKLVSLVISQEASNVSSSAVASDLITNKRSINTSLTLTPGEWIALGGLVNETVNTNSVGVPGLMNIPFLGRLFRIDKTESVKRDLSVLLRVTLV